MELVLHKANKDKPGKLEVSDKVFAAGYNEALVHQVLTAFMSGARKGTKAQKNRAAARGGGRKPWRQKGTGRARTGTIRNPLWRGGGVVFAAAPRDYKVRVNRKMYRGALRTMLSELARQERLSCVDTLAITEPKTREALDVLDGLGLYEALVIMEEIDENFYLATRNLPGVEVIDIADINPYRLAAYEHVVITKAAVEKVGDWLE
ncbi:MAG: 50S ribosomal protein L4 [Gammaproteobacteria bacterium]